MANFDFEDLKQKAKDAAGTIADVSVEVYKLAEEKAKTLARITKLNTEIAHEKSQIKKLYVSIGMKYYEQNKNAPAESLKQDCFEVTAAIGRIDEKRRELESLKNSSDECCGGACDCELEPEDEDEQKD